jgi:hypothetical protein
MACATPTNHGKQGGLWPLYKARGVHISARLSVFVVDPFEDRHDRPCSPQASAIQDVVVRNRLIQHFKDGEDGFRSVNGGRVERGSSCIIVI